MNNSIALIIIDMQPGFLAPLGVAESLELISRQRDLINFCQQKKIPVIPVEWFKEGDTIPEIKELLPKDSIRIIKRSDDAFFRTALDDVLQGYNVERIIVSGLNARACVLKTVKSAKDLRYKVSGSLDLLAGYGYYAKHWYGWYRRKKFFKTHLELMANFE